MIDKKRQEVFDELQHIEERMKKNFEIRNQKGEKEDGDTIDLLSKLEEGETDSPVEDKEKEEEKEEDVPQINESSVPEPTVELTKEFHEENTSASVENNRVEDEESVSRGTVQTIVETEDILETSNINNHSLMECDTSECL